MFHYLKKRGEDENGCNFYFFESCAKRQLVDGFSFTLSRADLEWLVESNMLFTTAGALRAPCLAALLRESEVGVGAEQT
jgi:hypothetical protein